jgi:hypothetical protein
VDLSSLFSLASRKVVVLQVDFQYSVQRLAGIHNTNHRSARLLVVSEETSSPTRIVNTIVDSIEMLIELFILIVKNIWE